MTTYECPQCTSPLTLRQGPTVRIESDGTPTGTRVLVDGELLDNVTEVAWTADANGRVSATVRLTDVEASVEADLATAGPTS